MRKPIKYVALAVAGIALLCCVVIAVIITVNPAPSTRALTPTVAVAKSSSSSSSVAQATSSPLSTNSPFPTVTTPPTSTPLPTATRTATPPPTPTIDVAADKKTYQTIDVRELEKAPDKYRDQKLMFTGEVFSIQEQNGVTGFQMWVDYPGSSALNRVAIIVQYRGVLPGLFKNDAVVVYGRGAGSLSGINALGGSITQPSLIAQYVDYGAAMPIPPAVVKNAPVAYAGKWELTYIGDYRDKTIFAPFAGGEQTAQGIFVTAQFRVKNLQSGTDSLGSDISFVAIGDDGKSYESNSSASINAAWQYGGYNTLFTTVQPGQDTVIVLVFDVPEPTKNLTIALKRLFTNQPLASPRFQMLNLDQIPAWKSKK